MPIATTAWSGYNTNQQQIQHIFLGKVPCSSLDLNVQKNEQERKLLKTENYRINSKKMNKY